MEGLAVKVGVSRSTASRFFSGRPTSLKVTLNIMAALHLKFEHVAKPQLDDVPGREDAAYADAALEPGGSCARLPVGSPARSDRAASSSCWISSRLSTSRMCSGRPGTCAFVFAFSSPSAWSQRSHQ